MKIQALMVDVDGVLIHGRPADGHPWLTSVEEDFGFTSATLHEHFFAPHWDSIIVGRTGLMEHLTPALRNFAPHADAANFVAYWFANDARLNAPLLLQLSLLRATGLRVYLATNQEHLRAAYLMDKLGLADHVDGILYSASLGAKKPDREFFTRAQATVGLQPGELLLLDDSQQNIDAALQAGWHALHWTPLTSPSILRTLLA